MTEYHLKCMLHHLKSNLNHLKFPLSGWLEPLLDRIARNHTTVVSPVIDIIADDTLEYNAKESAEVNVGGFDWSLQFSWHAIPDR